MTLKPIFFLAAAAGAGAILVSCPALAHHAVNAQFNVDKEEASFTGTLKKLDNIQPHSYWYFDVSKPDGKVEKWSLEGPSPGVIRRSGLRKEEIKVGETYTVFYNTSRDGSPTGYIRGVNVNGRRVGFALEAPTAAK